jgi:xanthine dehydrogenase YagR molybdenum-binding subunit
MTAAFTGRIEGPIKVTGSARFEGETQAPGMLHAALVEAPCSKGCLLGIDDAAARASAGVVGVISRAHCQDLRSSANTALIQSDQIHFAGQAVALVVAETSAQARDAAALVNVRYVEDVAVTSIHNTNAVSYAPEMTGARARAASLRGDPVAALESAACVVRGRFETATNNHHPMEPHAAVCWWEGERAVVHTCTQAIFGTRAAIAHAFGMLASDIRVVSKFLGGGFGCKGQLWFPWLFWTMLAARHTGRPVRLELTRAQLFTLVGRRSETVQEIAVGASATGELLAIDHQVLAQTSTHAEHADPVAAVSRLTYACGNVATGHRLVRTNEPHPIPMRGPGEAPGSFALESALDELAERLAIDPVTLRLANLAPRDQENDLPWSSNSLAECLRIGAERFGWHSRERQGWREGGLRVGRGMAVASYPARRQPCRMRMRLDRDATLTVECGTQDMGSGTYTTIAQMAAEQLGIEMRQVRVVLGDTILPEGPISAGSQVTQSFAPSLVAAAADLRRGLVKLLPIESNTEQSNTVPDDVILTAHGFLRRSASNVSHSLSDLLDASGSEWVEGNGEASGMPPEPRATGMGFGAVFAEVTVEGDLGEIRVRQLTAAYAAGRIVNPALARSQFISGLVGGIGMALHEQTRTDPRSGRIVGADLAEYLVPTNADMPRFDIVTVDEVDTCLPGGIKGVGMLGHVGTPAAIANAVYQATGVRLRHLPIRVEHLLGR